MYGFDRFLLFEIQALIQQIPHLQCYIVKIFYFCKQELFSHIENIFFIIQSNRQENEENRCDFYE